MQDPHINETVLMAGEPLERAQAAMILVHGRGANAESVLALTGEFNQPGFAYLAPQATANTWYPNSFLAPIPENEPWLSFAFKALAALLERVYAAGMPPERTILLGFSQGACLASEFVARNARRYGGLVGLSGGLIGPPGTPREYPGSLEGTPVFLGCSDADPHIPKERVLESAQVLEKLGGEVTARLYPGLGHTVNRDELKITQNMMAELLRENQA